jgi:DNA-binding NtrC family response regulator
MMFQDNYDRIDTNSPIALVAEDDDAARLRVAAYLRAKGFGVLEARTSVEALLLAVDFPDRIDALFTATCLRKYCNGVELAASLRAARPEMAVFYMDESGSPGEDVTRDLIEGQATLLAKPVSAPRLAEAVSLIDECRAWAGTAAERPEWI